MLYRSGALIRGLRLAHYRLPELPSKHHLLGQTRKRRKTRRTTMNMFESKTSISQKCHYYIHSHYAFCIYPSHHVFHAYAYATSPQIIYMLVAVSSLFSSSLGYQTNASPSFAFHAQSITNPTMITTSATSIPDTPNPEAAPVCCAAVPLIML